MIKSLSAKSLTTKLGAIAGVGIISSAALFGSSAHAQDSVYMKPIMDKMDQIEKIDNNSLSMENYTYNGVDDDFGAVGRMTTSTGEFSFKSGTAFAINDNTIITNAHVVEDLTNKTYNPKLMKFQIRQNGDKSDEEVGIKRIYKSTQSDIAILKTSESMKGKLKPLKIASQKKIKTLKIGDNLQEVGYPKIDGTTSQAKYSKDRYIALAKSSPGNQPLLVKKSLARHGASGSPVMNSNNEVVGMHAASFDGRTSHSEFYNQKLSMGPMYIGPTADFINHYKNK